MNDAYLDGKLSLLIIGLIIFLIFFYISYRNENKKTKETFFIHQDSGTVRAAFI
jgi:preprotein translocase subunit YajC